MERFAKTTTKRDNRILVCNPPIIPKRVRSCRMPGAKPQQRKRDRGCERAFEPIRITADSEMQEGCTKMIRTTALQVGVAASFALIVWNGYVVVSHVKHMRTIAALTLQSSMIQAEISGLMKDLTDMETRQRGYLLTNNPSHLQPYTEAKDRIAAGFGNLRAGLSNRGERERSRLCRSRFGSDRWGRDPGHWSVTSTYQRYRASRRHPSFRPC